MSGSGIRNRKSPRWKRWDYAAPAAYFVTTVTKNRRPFFGKIESGEMILNAAGVIALDCWKQLPDHFHAVELGEFIIMPDHVHGIIFIHERISETSDNKIIPEIGSATDRIGSGHALTLFDPDQRNTIEMNPPPFKPLRFPPVRFKFLWLNAADDRILTPVQKRFRNQGKNTVSAIVGSFKSAVSRLVRPIDPEFGWQRRFHDHVIRNLMEYERIKRYIRDNPSNWKSKK